jgi:hypothetical protein
MVESGRVSDPRSLSSAEEINLNHLGGIRDFIERCARIESINDEMRRLVESRWPELARKLPPRN